MIDQVHRDLTLLQFETLASEPRLVHAVTTRPQNFAPHRGVDADRAVHWREQVCEILGLPFASLTSPEQVHGADVLDVRSEEIGCGRDGRGSAVKYVDGLTTDKPGVPLILLSADCPLVLVFDPERPAVGAVHASWRGTVGGAAANLVAQMRQAYNSRPDGLRAAIAPSAGPCCYEVGKHVARIARGRLGEEGACIVERNGRVIFDLWSANRVQLIKAGVPAQQIEIAGACSICDPRFWSHRRDGETAGRFALWLGLRRAAGPRRP